MTRIMVINGSPRMEKGNTALVLGPFIDGMQAAGSEVDLVYASRLRIKPCACGRMACWEQTPGVCCMDDDMTLLYPRLKAAQIVVLATPVYIPLPGDMANLINRLCPMLDPDLVFRRRRMRAKMRPEYAIRAFALVCTCGWWEKANCATVVRIVKELAEDASVGFGGALLRPHANSLRRLQHAPAGQAVLGAARRAGEELARDGVMSPAALRLASRALVSRQAWMG